jgi:hypothetical protein
VACFGMEPDSKDVRFGGVFRELEHQRWQEGWSDAENGQKIGA